MPRFLPNRFYFIQANEFKNLKKNNVFLEVNIQLTMRNVFCLINYILSNLLNFNLKKETCTYLKIVFYSDAMCGVIDKSRTFKVDVRRQLGVFQ